MRIHRWETFAFFVAGLALAGCGGSAAIVSSPASMAAASNLIPSLQPYATAAGTVATYSGTGGIDPNGIFFRALGSNQRNCGSCHRLRQGMSISASGAQALFAVSDGADPLFDAVDGANCPTVAAGDAAGHSLVLDYGLIRIARELPAGAQFEIVPIQDPYGCAATSDFATGQPVLSVYRRPLPTSSLTFLSDVMWDARDTVTPLNAEATFRANLDMDLGAQAAEAVATHEQGNALLSSAELAQLVGFEEGLYTAQASDNQAGALSGNGATGGAANLAVQSYFPGINDPGAAGPQGSAFSPAVFTLFQSWRGSANPQQASIARGEDIFNTAPMRIAGVGGLNDVPGSPAVIRGSCGTCHDTPNVGNRSLPLAMDTGISHLASSETDASILAGLQQLTAPLLPVYGITGCADGSGSPMIYDTTDPGEGLTTGLCADVNRVKVPILRGLAARAPYFHNGSAANLDELVNFYNARFQMNLSPQQRQDLENFLNAL